MSLLSSDMAAAFLLRAGTGLAIVRYHGWHKLADGIRWRSGRATSWFFAAEVGKAGSPVPVLSAWLVTLVQLGCGLGLVAGLCTRLCSLAILCTLFGAAYANARFRRESQLVLVYVLLLSAVFLNGAGPWSLDRLLVR